MVVVAGGAYGTPPILLALGVGPADDLREPHRGARRSQTCPSAHGLRDHPQTMFEFEVQPREAR